ncbi:MAG: hypothetical protein RBG13Loki_2740 [Promethearchaeota archaeon CR_4]|nr:MAG: hypothetical protein RBG13Loki_2740 [Candidatus Lokiarchaeota archaeon CR_4]
MLKARLLYQRVSPAMRHPPEALPTRSITMVNKFVKLQAFSAVIILGLLATSYFILPSGTIGAPSQLDGARENQKSPNAAAVDLDVDFLHYYLDSVFEQIETHARDPETEFGLDDTFFHIMTDDWSTVYGGDTDKYSFDNILTYFGLWSTYYAYLGEQELIETFKDAIVGSPLYTNFGSVNGSAFRWKMGQNGTNPVDTYHLVDNALSLFSLLRYCDTNSVAPANTTALNLYKYLSNVLWHPDDYFLGSNGTDPGEAMSYNNLLGALVLSMLARNKATIFSGSIKSQAENLAQRAFAAVNISGIFEQFGASQGVENNFRESRTIGDRSLKTNALGVAAFADFYLRSGRAAANKSALTLAENLCQVIWDHFYEPDMGTSGGFVDVLNGGDGSIKINQTSLEGNAYWLLALGRLFEASGNITYYEKAIEVYQQVVANLWDETNLGFIRSTGDLGTDSNKSVGENALFYLFLKEIDEAYWKTKLTFTTPMTELVVHAGSMVNFTWQYNMTFTSENNVDINQGIGKANVTMNLRYDSNGSFINAISNYTNVNGTCTFLYPLPEELPLGLYSIYAFANRTGFGTAYQVTYFSIVSNISVPSEIDPAIKIVQGESIPFNLTFTNERNNATYVICNGTGPELSMNAATFFLANNTETNANLTIAAGIDAPLGDQKFNLTLVNDSRVIFETQLDVEVLPAVSFEYLEFSRSIVAGVNGEMFIVLENARPTTQESVNITLRGADLQDVTQLISLQPKERVKVYVPLNYTGTHLTGTVTFDVNVSRYTQTIQSSTYTSNLARAIEIQGVSTSTGVVQGRSFYVNIRALNNVNITRQIDVSFKVNGQLVKLEANITLTPGENDLIVEVNPLTSNPWDVTTYELDVNITVGSETVFQDRLLVQSILSIESIIFAYVLPIVFPIAIILILLQRKKKRDMLR